MKKILLVSPAGMYGGGEVYIKKTNHQVFILAKNTRLINELTPIVDQVFLAQDAHR